MNKLILLLQGKALLIELPEGATDAKINPVNSWRQEIACWDGHRWKDVSLPEGNWRIIGMLGEVTNAELADVTGFYYNKYNERYVEMPTSAMRATPIGDIEDAILAEGYYLDENPIAVPDFSGGNIRFSETVEYAKAQFRVLDRSRCLLLGREDG